MVRDLGIKETGILVSCSDYHIFKKMKMTRAQALDHYLGTVKDAFDAGVMPRCHLEDITRADFYGFVVPFVNELVEALRGGRVFPLRSAPAIPWAMACRIPRSALPRSVPGIIYGLQHYSDVPSEMLEWHGHNDFYKAVANASTAWLYGACAVNCSLLGIGERTGNVPLEAMVFEYAAAPRLSGRHGSDGHHRDRRLFPEGYRLRDPRYDTVRRPQLQRHQSRASTPTGF